MLRPPVDAEVYLYASPVDMRKSIDGLAALVEAELPAPPMGGALFVFCNRSRDKVKLLVWERNGFVLWYKRLERERFRWPKDDGAVVLSGQELNWLLDGFDIFNNRPHQSLTFSAVS